MTETEQDSQQGYLTGQLLISTLLIQESCFAKAVIYVLAHDATGAMGLIINHTIDNVDSSVIFNHLNIDPPTTNIPVHFGGPVESNRGFILHTKDYDKDHFELDSPIALSSNVDILKDIAAQNGPQKSIFALGYAGWDAGQLEEEITGNSWLIAPATEDLVFNDNNTTKWVDAAASIGVDITNLSLEGGKA